MYHGVLRDLTCAADGLTKQCGILTADRFIFLHYQSALVTLRDSVTKVLAASK